MTTDFDTDDVMCGGEWLHARVFIYMYAYYACMGMCTLTHTTMLRCTHLYAALLPSHTHYTSQYNRITSPLALQMHALYIVH
jgi:hypothetical protein